MAKNENTSLKNNHTLYLAKSGYGKSQTLIRTSGLFKPGRRTLIWDPNKDHDAHRFESLAGFARAVASAEKSGRGYRLAYCGEPSPDAFEIFANVVWCCLDGNKITDIVIEEYSDCCRGPGLLSQQKDYYHRKLWTQARKYGGIIHATSQRPQLISKDALGNAGIFYASCMDIAAAKRIAAEMDIRVDLLRDCQVGEFFYRNNGSEAVKQKIFAPIEAKTKRTEPTISLKGGFTA